LKVQRGAVFLKEISAHRKVQNHPRLHTSSREINLLIPLNNP
jgi:hypothetical protein